jgi:putative ABC transport system permease protein
MILPDTFQLSMRNLRQAKLRTALTTLGVAIGVGALTCMVSLGVGLQEQFLGRFLRSGIFDSITVFPENVGFGRNSRGGRAQAPADGSTSNGQRAKPEKPPAKLDDDALGRMRALDRVKEVYPNLRVPVEVQYGTFSEFSAAAGVPLSAEGKGIFQKVSYGSFFPNDTEGICMLGMEFAKKISDLDPKELVGKEIVLGYATPGGAVPMLPIPGLRVQRAEKKFRIVGILEREPGPDFGGGLFGAIMLPLRKAQELGSYDLTNPQALLQQLSDKRAYMSVTVKVRKPQDIDEVEKTIKDMGYSAFSLNDMLQGAKKAFVLLDLLLSLTGSVALTVASLGIVNTMVMSILERTREIGIMKAIGGSDGDIRRIFLVEASVIGLAGGIAGMVLGWSVGRAINFGANIYIKSQGGSPENMFLLPWWLIMGGIAFSIVVSLLAGSYPAGRAARLDPIQALRHD